MTTATTTQEDINPYASPENLTPPTPKKSWRTWAQQTLRALIIGPALVILVMIAIASLFSTFGLLATIGGLVLLHWVDRALFTNKKFIGRSG